MMEWPEHYPKACPPADSVDAKGSIFRIIKSGRPLAKNFESHWIKMPHKHKEWQNKGEACQSCGLSVLTSIDDAKMVMDTIRHLGDKVYIAKLDGKSGKIKHTPCDLHERHYTWWVPITVEKPWLLFKVVA